METNQEKHTPGPWLVDENCLSLIYSDETEAEIAYVEDPADAALIAAAPNLLASLKALLTAEMLHETAMGHGDESAMEAANEAKWPAVDAARAAIAKAEGKSDTGQ